MRILFGPGAWNGWGSKSSSDAFMKYFEPYTVEQLKAGYPMSYLRRVCEGKKG